MQYRNSTYADGNFDAYWFEKNLQGDIVAVYSTGGTKLVSYSYDAWGNITTTYHNGGGSTAAAIGHAGGNVDTTSIVENLTVTNVAINGEDAAHTGSSWYCKRR